MQKFDIEEPTLPSEASCGATSHRFEFYKGPGARHFEPTAQFLIMKGTRR